MLITLHSSNKKPFLHLLCGLLHSFHWDFRYGKIWAIGAVENCIWSWKGLLGLSSCNLLSYKWEHEAQDGQESDLRSHSNNLTMLLLTCALSWWRVVFTSTLNLMTSWQLSSARRHCSCPHWTDRKTHSKRTSDSLRLQHSKWRD